MKRWQKILFGVGFSFLFCFMCVGYAAVNDTLTVDGEINYSPPEGVYIRTAERASGNATVQNYIGATLFSTVDLGSDRNGTATVKVVLKNNSDFTYYFKGVLYEQEAYSNSDIQFTLDGLVLEQQMTARSELTVNVTFSYVSGTSLNYTALTSVLNFSFDTTPAEKAVSGALGRFDTILNDATLLGQLTTAIDTDNRERNDNSYIGNVVGSDSADSTALNTLFTVDGKNALTLEIDGVETNVTAMIKRENIDGVAGDEWTIYMTAEDLESQRTFATVDVYAAVFIKDAAGKWKQLGQVYKGTARVNGYDGNWFATTSVNTDTWSTTNSYYGLTGTQKIDALTAAAKKEAATT